MSTRPCPGCSGTGVIVIPTAHRQRPVWHLCAACNPELLDEAGAWRVAPFWRASDPAATENGQTPPGHRPTAAGRAPDKIKDKIKYVRLQPAKLKRAAGEERQSAALL